MSRTPTNGSDDPVEKDDGEANVSCSPPQDEMVVRDLTPVGCEDTHGHVVSCMTPNNDHTIVGAIRQTQEKLERAIKRCDSKKSTTTTNQHDKGKNFQNKNAACIRWN